MSVKFQFEKRLNADNKFAEVKTATRKNFYVTGQDSKGNSFIGTIEDATRLEATNEGRAWAKRHGLTYEGVYCNN